MATIFSYFNFSERKPVQSDVYFEEQKYDINEYNKLRCIEFQLDDLIPILVTQIYFYIDVFWFFSTLLASSCQVAVFKER